MKVIKQDNTPIPTRVGVTASPKIMSLLSKMPESIEGKALTVAGVSALGIMATTLLEMILSSVMVMGLLVAGVVWGFKKYTTNN